MRRTATLEQFDRGMEVNVVPHRQPTGCAWLIPRTLELFRTPSLDALHLGQIDILSVHQPASMKYAIGYLKRSGSSSVRTFVSST